MSGWSARTRSGRSQRQGTRSSSSLEGSRYPGESIDGHYEEAFQAWRERQPATTPMPGRSPCDVAPDRLHKDNTSGGPPYGTHSLRDPERRRPRPRRARRATTGCCSGRPDLNDASAHGGFPDGEYPWLPRPRQQRGPGQEITQPGPAAPAPRPPPEKHVVPADLVGNTKGECRRIGNLSVCSAGLSRSCLGSCHSAAPRTFGVGDRRGKRGRPPLDVRLGRPEWWWI